MCTISEEENRVTTRKKKQFKVQKKKKKKFKTCKFNRNTMLLLLKEKCICTDKYIQIIIRI